MTTTESLKQELVEIERASRPAGDRPPHWGALWGRLRAAQDTIRGELRGVDRTGAFEELQRVRAALQEASDRARGRADDEARAIEHLVRAFELAADEALADPRAWRPAREADQEAFAALRSGGAWLARDQRDALWQRLQARREALKAAERERRARMEAEGHELEQQISAFEELTGQAAAGGRPGPELQEARSQLFAAFKEKRLPKDLRDRLWDRFKHILDEERARNERRRARSKEIRARITETALSGRPAGAIVDFIEAVASIAVTGATFGRLPVEVDRELEALQYWRQKLDEAFTLFTNERDALFGEDRAKARETLRDEKAALDAQWQQRKERIAAEREERREARRASLSQQIERLLSVLDRKEATVAQNRDRLAGARGDAARERFAAWIDEGEEQAAELRAKIATLEDKLRALS